MRAEDGGPGRRRAARRVPRAWGRWLLAALGLVGALGSAAPTAAQVQTAARITGIEPWPLTRTNVNGATVHMEHTGVSSGGIPLIFTSQCGDHPLYWNVFEGHANSNRHLLIGEPSGVTVRVRYSRIYGGYLNRQNCSIRLSVTGTLPSSDWDLTIRGNHLILDPSTGVSIDNPYTIGTVRVYGTAQTVLVVDANPATTFVESTRAVTVGEGASAAYTVKLASQPSGAVTVSVASSDTGAATATPSSLTFTGGTTGSWNTVQTVTVRGADDADSGDESVTVSHTAAAGSSDSGYTFGTARTTESVAVTVTDVAVADLVLSESALTLTEGTSPTATYTVRLGKQPTGGVQVQVGRGDPGYTLHKAGGTQGVGQTLDFTATTWNTGQAITVIAFDDANTVGGTSNITHTTVGANTVAEYDPVSKNLPVTLIDDEAVIVVSRGTGALALGEGSSAAPYTVALGGPPTGAVVVQVTSDDAGAVTVGPGALTYSTTSWNTGQAVTVTAGTDTDGSDERVTVTHAVEAGNSADEFDGAPDVTFTVTVEADARPTFGERTVPAQQYVVGSVIPVLTLPRAEGGNGRLTYTLTGPAGADPPAGLRYTPPPVEEAHGGTLSGTPTEAQPATPYTLTATDGDGDVRTLTFTIAVRTPVRVTLADATAVEGRPVEFTVTVSRAVARPLTLHWTAGRPGSATPGEDYQAVAAGQVTVAAGATAGTLVVWTLDDRRVEPSETFTVTVTVPAETSIELAQGTAAGRIEDDDTEQARRRSLGMVLAGVGRTLATDAVDVIGDRFVRPPTAAQATVAQATVGGQAVDLNRGPQRGRWRHAAGVAYGVARALGVEVGSPLAGGDGQFEQVRGAAWSTLTRHLRAPHAPTLPLSASDAPGAFATPAGPGWEGPAAAGWGSPRATDGHPLLPPPSGQGFGPAPDLSRGDGSSAGHRVAGDSPFGPAPFPGLAGYGRGLGQVGFDRAHAATPPAVQGGALRAPVQFRRVAGAEVLAQSQFEVPLSWPAPLAVATEGPPAAGPPIEAGAAAWTLWGRGTASGFDGKPKADFSMDGTVFTGYLGMDYRLQPTLLLGLAVAHSQGDVDYETADVTKGEVDVTLTSILPYAHWSPRPGLGVWGLLGAGWGDLKLRDEAGRVKTDLEMLLGAVGARQEVLRWRRIDVALKADAFLTELEAGSDDRLPETAGDAQRLRLMVEGRTAWAMSEHSHLTPVFEVGGRWDGGKAETGVGAELGGGLEYAHTQLGVGIEARGRYLLAHQKSAFDEWGASLTLRLDPGADKRGLWLALAPVWGAEASQVEQLWGSAEGLRAGAESDTPPSLSPAQVEFDMGYGLVTHEGAGLLTTYGGVSTMGPDRHGVRLGGRIELGEWVDLSMEGERTTQGGGAEHQVALYGHIGW